MLEIFINSQVQLLEELNVTLPIRQILVPETSRGRPPQISPVYPLKVLFNYPGDILKWRPGDILIWYSRDVAGRLIREANKTFSGRPLEDL